MGKKDFQIILTIVIFCACVFSIWKYIQKPENQEKVYDFLASDRFYSKKMKFEQFYMTPDQIPALFDHDVASSKNIKNLEKTTFPIYIVIRIKNIGNQTARGVLSCQTPNFKEFEVFITLLNPNQHRNYIIPTCYTTSNPPPCSPIIKWRKTYTQK